MILVNILVSILCFLPIRDIAAYNEYNLFQSYITTKNKILAILLSRKPKIFKVRKGGEEYRITALGIVLYIITAVMIIIAFIALFIIEEVPTTETIHHRGTVIIINNLNESCALNLLIATMIFNVSLCELNTSNLDKRNKIISIIFWSLLILASIAIAIYGIVSIIKLL